MIQKYKDELSTALLWAGGLNIGAIGLFEQNILHQVFSTWPLLLKFIYISIGISAIYKIATHKKQ